MDLTIHVKVELVETPALINCFAAFCSTIERCTQLMLDSNREFTAEAEVTVPAPVQPKTVEAPAEAPSVPVEEPKKAEPKKYTLDDFRTACTPLLAADASLGAKIKEIINAFGVNSLPELPEEKYPELAAKLSELGVNL